MMSQVGIFIFDYPAKKIGVKVLTTSFGIAILHLLPINIFDRSYYGDVICQ